MPLDSKLVTEAIESFNSGLKQQAEEGHTLQAIVVFALSEADNGSPIVGTLCIGRGDHIHKAIEYGLDRLTDRMDAAVLGSDGVRRDKPQRGDLH